MPPRPAAVKMDSTLPGVAAAYAGLR